MLAGRWRLGTRLGEGGHGTVYEAFEHGTPVAVKFLHSTRRLGARDLETRLARLAERMEAVAPIRHPALPTFLAWGADAERGTLYVVMERLHGRPADRLRLGDEALEGVAHHLLAGLEALHARAQLHGDIKPANILLEPDGRAVLADLALPVLPDEDAPFAEGVALGSPSWLAPECLHGEPASMAADIYALGQSLAELHLGRPLFALEGRGAGRLIALMERKRTAPAVDLPDASPALRELVRLATDPRPSRRPEARELLDPRSLSTP